jgi:hypothetical protein
MIILYIIVDAAQTVEYPRRLFSLWKSVKKDISNNNAEIYKSQLCEVSLYNISYTIKMDTYVFIMASTYIPLTLYPRRGSRGVSDIAPMPTFYQNYLALRNTADVTGGKPIAV